MSKLTDSAKGKTCIRCGADDGTVCARHYNGVRQHAYGKGMRQKCSDIATADFCSKCDDIFTEGSTRESVLKKTGIRVHWSDEWGRSEDFTFYITMSNIRRYENGELEAK